MEPRPPSSDPCVVLVESTSRSLRFAIAVAVALLAAMPFFRTVSHPFLAWDDGVNIVANEGFRGLDAGHLRWMWSTFHTGHYMPLTWMSFALDFALGGV